VDLRGIVDLAGKTGDSTVSRTWVLLLENRPPVLAPSYPKVCADPPEPRRCRLKPSSFDFWPTGPL